MSLWLLVISSVRVSEFVNIGAFVFVSNNSLVSSVMEKILRLVRERVDFRSSNFWPSPTSASLGFRQGDLD